MRKKHKRLQKTATGANELKDLETQHANLKAAGYDTTEIENDMNDLKRRFPKYSRLQNLIS